MTKGTHLLRSALLALLALAVISGGSLAAGDLFDDDYSDCPHRTRLRDGQIADLSVNRDSEEEDEVNVAWAATDPATWGLGANAYSTSLVVILDDGTDVQTETLSLGSRKTTFDAVDTGTEVTVQMAIVVDTADGDYLISDILEQRIDQSLTQPSFMASVMQVTTPAAGADTPADTTDDVAEVLGSTGGTMYYVGYNENFGNYKEDTYSFNTRPDTARLNIGLAHSAEEDDDDRDDVDFDAYVLRVTDEDGDVVSEGDDVTSKPTSYGTTNRLVFGTLDQPATASVTFQNVRLDDGAQAAVFDGGTQPAGLGGADGTTVGTYTAGTITPATSGLSYIAPAAGAADNTLFAPTPDEHRLFPTDALSSDVTYTITAWAINDEDEVISPVASLKVRPIDERVSLGTTALADYVTAGDAPDNATPGADDPDRILVTEFTVLD